MPRRRYDAAVIAVLLIAAAGALGALSRYGVSLLAAKWLGEDFPFGTLIVNVLGCLLLGFLAQGALGNPALSRHLKLAIGTGFLGSFTTFSTFGVETINLMERGEWGSALANVALNLVVGLGCAALGMAAARACFE